MKINLWSIIAILVYAIALPGRAETEGPLSIQQVARNVNHPTIGAPVELKTPLSFGRITIIPAPKTNVYQLVAGDQLCGLFVSRGTLTYRIDDPLSLPLALRNIETTTDILTRPKKDILNLELPISELLVWSWQLPDTNVIESDLPRPKIRDHVLSKIGDFLFHSPGADLVAARGEGSPARAYLLFQSGKDNFQAEYRPNIEKNESLWVLDRVKASGNAFKGSVYRKELVTQPVGRPWFISPPRPTVSQHTELEIRTDTSEDGIIKSLSSVRANRPTSIWRVNLQSERLIKNQRHPTRIQSVTVNERKADWVLDHGEILVNLDPPLTEGIEAEISVTYSAKVAIRRNDYQFWYLGTWAWYPQPDLGGESSTFRITLTVPEEYEPFASGTTESHTTKNGFTTLVTALEQPMQFPVVAAGRYTVEEKSKDGYTCRVATYGPGNKKGVDRMIHNFFSAKNLYEELLGAPYPFKELTFIERNSWGFGQAPPGIIFITQEAFESISDEQRQFFSQGVNERLIHEIAHGWWGHVVKMNSPEEQWISEAFSEYCAAVALEIQKGKRKGKQEFKSMVKHWRGHSKHLDQGASLFLANHFARESSSDDMDRWQLMYAKGPYVLHALRLKLRENYRDDDKGDEIFFTMMRSMISSFPFGYGETRHIVGILNQLTGEDWSQWFFQYVFGTEVPDLDLK